MRVGRLAISTASSFKQEEEKKEEEEGNEPIGNDRKSRVPSGPDVGRREANRRFGIKSERESTRPIIRLREWD